MKKTAAAHLEPAEIAHLRAIAHRQKISVSAYLRHLVLEDMRRAESEALMALSVDELANTQLEHGRLLAHMQSEVRDAFQEMHRQIAAIAQASEHLIESEQKLRQQLLESHTDTAHLIERALTECRDILDADNSILEAIERRLRQGGA